MDKENFKSKKILFKKHYFSVRTKTLYIKKYYSINNFSLLGQRD